MSGDEFSVPPNVPVSNGYAKLELGTVFEILVTTDTSTQPKCILQQGQSFRGILRKLILYADINNSGTLYVGSEGLCKFPLAPKTSGILANISLDDVYPQNIFFTGAGTDGLILHGISGGVSRASEFELDE